MLKWCRDCGIHFMGEINSICPECRSLNASPHVKPEDKIPFKDNALDYWHEYIKKYGEKEDNKNWSKNGNK